MAGLDGLEKSLDGVFVKNAPELPAGGKKFLVDIAPWVSLVVGIVSLWMVFDIWHWAHVTNSLIDYANQISAAVGGTQVAHRLTVTLWLSMAVLAIEGVMYIAAFPGLKARKKTGWNLLFYALLVNLVYSIIVSFTDYGSFGNLIWAAIGFAIGAYFTFQIRASYKK